ncbi:unnamed protein product [Adineta ricciae]|uniref:Epoxide hydrolase n=1 Tax=Adineta ricciae TaxID=249248 RepID=A0A814ZRB7_ADIRI|nr:unnamed protein product [Adineta ricciae]CAF1465206.1 unnamed protein product [Adineta ricciae]
MIEPFRIDIPQSALDDPKYHLEWTRWPDRETVDDWKQGVPLEKAKSLVDYWRLYYDWRRFENRATTDGIRTWQCTTNHIYPYGRPGSFIEFLRVIPRLTNPTTFGGKAEDAFHIVVPSIPGYGFSDKPKETEWHTARIARAWVILMQRLGYQKWIAQGGDWGTDIAIILGSIRPIGLLGIHLNFQYVFPDDQSDNFSPGEQRAIDIASHYLSDGWEFFSVTKYTTSNDWVWIVTRLLLSLCIFTRNSMNGPITRTSLYMQSRSMTYLITSFSTGWPTLVLLQHDSSENVVSGPIALFTGHC